MVARGKPIRGWSVKIMEQPILPRINFAVDGDRCIGAACCYCGKPIEKRQAFCHATSDKQQGPFGHTDCRRKGKR